MKRIMYLYEETRPRLPRVSAKGAREQQARVVVDTLRRALGDVVAVYQFGSSVAGSTHPCTSFGCIALVPQETREAFSLLETAGMLDHALADQLRKMVGFRNVAIHEYQRLNLDTVSVHTKKEVGTGLAQRILKEAGL